MISKVWKKTIISVLIIGSFSVSYYYFSQYKPKILSKIEEVSVKGIKSDNGSTIPYPFDAIKLGSSKTNNADQITFKTTKNIQEIHSFYKNVFLEDREWQLDTEQVSETNLSTTYSKKDSITRVTATRLEEDTETTVTVDIIKR